MAVLSLCCFSVTKSCLTLWDPMNCSMPGSSVLHYSLEFAQIMFIELVMLSNHLTLCHPLLLLPSIFPSIRVFSNELALPMRWPEYWSFNFSISPSNEYLGLISLGLTDLLSFQLKRFSTLPQPHSLKVSILWYSAVFMVQLSHLYMTTGKP